MSEKSHTNDSDAQSTMEHWVQTVTGSQEQVVQAADLQDVSSGDAIAVRAAGDAGDTILAGRVTAGPPTDLDAKVAQAREDASEYIDESTSVRIVFVSIDAATLWLASDGTVTDKGYRLEDRPPVQKRPELPVKDPPDCSLSYRDDGFIELNIPAPVSNGRRVKYYAPGPRGGVVDCLYGGLVDPAQVLPDGYSRPD